jgi:hypothetical protein
MSNENFAVCRNYGINVDDVSELVALCDVTRPWG